MAGVVGGKSSSSNRGRAYGMMLLLAFGAAVFGVLILHKLRERRLLNLLIKDKDRDIVTLQLLLQKERDISKEVKTKIEEMKVKAVTLRNQKAELTNRLAQMQTITVSLTEEIKSLEAALDEKENKIKFLEDREENQPEEDFQAVKYALKQKEAEIEELKQRLENQALSISLADPSKSLVKLTNAREEDVPSQDGQLGKPMEDQNGESSTTTVDAVDDTNEEHKKPERNSVNDSVLITKSESHGEHVKVEEGQRYSNSEKLESSARSTSMNQTGENGGTDAAEKGLNFVKLKYTKLVTVEKGGESGATQVQNLGESQNGSNPLEGPSNSSLLGVHSMTRGEGDNRKKSKSKRRRIISTGNEVKLSVNAHSNGEGRDAGGFETEKERERDGGVGLEKLQNPRTEITEGNGEGHEPDGEKTEAMFIQDKGFDVTARSSKKAESSGENTHTTTNGTSQGSGQTGDVEALLVEPNDDHDNTASITRNATSHEELQVPQKKDKSWSGEKARPGRKRGPGKEIQ